MVKESILKTIATRAGIDADKFITAVKAESEIEFNVEGSGEFLTDEELETIKSESKKGSYEDGKKVGFEVMFKEVKKLTGLEIDGKTFEKAPDAALKLVDSLKEKFTTEAGKEPNTKIAELENDKKKLQLLVDEKEGLIQSKESELTNLFIEAKIKSRLPEKTETGLTRDDLFTLYGSRRKFQRTENDIQLIDPKSGEQIKDKKMNPVKIETDIEEFLAPYGKPKNNGAGGSDDPGAASKGIESIKKMSDVHLYIEKNNIPLSQQSAILAKAAKNEGFDYNG